MYVRRASPKSTRGRQGYLLAQQGACTSVNMTSCLIPVPRPEEEEVAEGAEQEEEPMEEEEPL